MDRRSWLWRRKSSEKSHGETESSGSVSPYSGVLSDDQEVSRTSPNNASPSHSQSPDVSSNSPGTEVNATVKILTEKLSAALLNISAKEDLVKQHMKVAEEAVAGWEKAETELAALKRQLEAAAQKNSALEDRIGHLDEALKESVRQFRQSRERQEQGINDMLMKKTREWESDKFDFENRITELQVQLEAARAEAAFSVDHYLQSKLEASEKENLSLKVELLSRTKDLQAWALEKELSTKAAESASKQHLESIKKVAKLEAECRRLRTVACKSSSANDQKFITNLANAESLTDSQSDSGERFLGIDEPSSLDSWASALITERDQCKKEKESEKKTVPSMEIDIMGDFLEMERLVALPETDRGSCTVKLETEVNQALTGNSELEAIRLKMVTLEEKLTETETEKAELELVLTDTRNRLELACHHLKVAEDKCIVQQRLLNSANESKLVALTKTFVAEEKGKAFESQLESAQAELRKLHEKLHVLQGQVERDKILSTGFAAKIESVEATRKAVEYQLLAANIEVKNLRDKAYALEVRVEEEKAVSSEYKSKAEALAEETKALECQLESARCEVKRLNQKVDVLEGMVAEEKAKSAESEVQVVSSESKRKAIECQFDAAHLEIRKQHENAKLLEARVEEEMSISAALATKVEAEVAVRAALETQLKLAQLEVGELHVKVGLLEKRIMEEKASSAKSSSKYHYLEGGLGMKKQEAELQLFTRSNNLINKEYKDLASAAGKLADCQKTIASLSRQLKSLASFDDFALEIETTSRRSLLRY